MKKYLLYIGAALLFTASCTKADFEDPVHSELISFQVGASIESTKALLQTDGKVFWEEGDEIAVYDGKALRRFTLTGGAGTSSAKFAGEIDSSATQIEAVYPFDAAMLKDSELSFTVKDQSVPAGQKADPKALVSKAEKVDLGSSLTFRNKTSLLRFTVNGAATVYLFADPKDSPFGDGEKRGLKVECPSEGSFCAAVVPGQYHGFNIFVGDRVKNAVKPLKADASTIVDLGEVSDGTKAQLIWNLSDLNSYLASPQADGYIMDVIDAAAGITPSASAFEKTLDGQGNAIMNWTSEGKSIVPENAGTLKNIVLDSSCTLSFPSKISGDFGFITSSSTGNVSGCVNNADITWNGTADAGVTSYTAAIVGNSSVTTASVLDCVNNGKIDITVTAVSQVNYWAGVVARAYRHTIDSCSNSGDLAIKYTVASSYNNYIGGICAVGNSVCQVNSCTNSGNISLNTVSGDQGVILGGVLAYGGDGSMTECTNSGSVSYISEAGIKGTMVGGVCAYNAGTLSKCSNTGDVEISGTAFKGRNSIGYIDGTNSKSTAVIFAGGVIAVGAPSGATTFRFEIHDSYNSGKVSMMLSKMDDSPSLTSSGRIMVGGVVGDASGPVENCVNDGDVDVKMIASSSSYTASNAGYTPYVGGVVGGNYYSTVCRELELTSCTNHGNVYLRSDNRHTTTHCVAGIVGEVGNNDSANPRATHNCTNTGNVTGEGNAVMRIAGIMSGSARTFNCVNEGTVTSNTAVNKCYVGGIAGFHSTGMEFAGCRNTGKIVNNNTVQDSCCGGLIGLHGNSATTTGAGCEVDCEVEGPSSSSNGIVIGGFNGTSKQLVYGTSGNPIVVGGSVKTGSTVTELTAANYKEYLGGALNASATAHTFYTRHVSEPAPSPMDKFVNGTEILTTSDIYGLITDSVTGKGIPGVPVTDGYKYVKTDENGVYQMTSDARCLCVTVSVPSNYEVPMNDTTHAAAFFANDLDPVAFDRRDFTLTPTTPKTRFTLVAVGDMHIGRKSGSTSSDWIATASERFRSTTVADMRDHVAAQGYENVYMCSVGDESNSNNTGQWPTIQTMTRDIQLSDGSYVPFFHSMGNHDHMGDCGTTESDFYVNQRKRFISYLGPADYSVNIGNAHIVFLDNAAYNGATAYRLYNASWEWLKADIAQVTDQADKMLILVYHCPFCGGVSEDGSPRFAEHREDILNLAKSFHQVHMITGHTHRAEEYVHTDFVSAGGTPIKEHILGMCGGTYWIMHNCPDGSPQAYSVYNVDGNELTDYYTKTVGKPQSFQMRVYNGSAAIQAPGSSDTYYWYSATSTMTNSSSGTSYTTYGDERLNGCFVVNLWGANDADWTVELWKNGSKVGNLERIPTINDQMNNAYTYFNGEGNTDQTRRDVKHFYYIKAPGGDPAAETGWTVRATHKVEGSKGKTMVYECSELTTGFDPFIW